ncbi:hypothetical protein AURDEDRAFT_122859 [Auricularia subglabra TFB-10046 SS5]|nr:hypothetical protein AURDEDRAFT_122859 [Auricularia subglabra TFB-10046 SS5]
MSNHATVRPATTATGPLVDNSCNKYLACVRRMAGDELWASLVGDADVQAAFAGLAESYPQPTSGIIPALRLLNTISLTYTTLENPPDAVIFARDYSKHDYLGAGRTPDWVSYASTIGDIRDAVHKSTTRPKGPARLSRDWSTFLGPGECGFHVEGRKLHAFIDWWLNIVKMYRPDLTTIHGLRFSDGALRLSSFNANGRSHSGDLPLRTLDAWIAHVVLLYDSLSNRDTRFRYQGPGEHTARWMFQTGADDGTELCIEPFVVSSTTGRRTWAAFSTCCHGGEANPVHNPDVEGFLKISWQRQTRGECSEGELLDKAHATSWLPGLVRHWGYWEEDGPGTVIDHGLRLHRALDERGILHRDLSTLNFLCEPKHDPVLLLAYKDKPVGSVKEVPCIGYVLLHRTGDETQEPCVLLTDLDMSVLSISEVGTRCPPPLGTIGTPLFISIEKSSKERETMLPLGRSALDGLLKKLGTIDSYPTQRQRMFPGDEDNGFMGFVEHVFELEARRPVRGTTSPGVGHLPRHDVESIFWDLLWALARACPLGSDPLDDVDGEFSRFLDAMFKHDYGKETRRPYFTAARFEEILHPQLRRFAPLLEDMLLYLSIPWHLHDVYDEYIGRYHAHIAMERLLFAEIYAITLDPSLDVELDIDQPRIRNLLEDQEYRAKEAARTPTPAAPQATAAAAAAATRSTTTRTSASAASTLAGAASDADKPQGPLERKRADENDDPAASSKRQEASEELPAAPSYNIRHLSDISWRYRWGWLGYGDFAHATNQPAREAMGEWLAPYRKQPKRDVDKKPSGASKPVTVRAACADAHQP